MAISWKIFPELSLVYVRYWDRMGVEESRLASEAYMSHPDFRPGLRQFVDLTDVTDYDRDYVEVLKLQAQHAEMFAGTPVPNLVLCLAPHAMAQSIGQFVMRSWENVDDVISSIVMTPEHAREILGLTPARFDALMERAE